MSEHPSNPREQRSAERVRSYLRQQGIESEVIEFDRSTKTAALAADAVGCELGQIVKSLVFVVDSVPRLVLVAGDRRGDIEAIAAASGGDDARIATPDEVREATGYAIGGVSPFDLPEGLEVYIDESFDRFEVVYSAAGTPNTVVPIALDTLIGLCGGARAKVAE